ncbi:ABC transporter permease [Actinomadura rubrisoli]|uniref:ABC transporter permease n=1 Tax=Actinomadura rubrisoli TaxID=2530368 RepID=A0A4R5BAF4_9ACTN|nr:FtsX-like permease family protein [Actinomadura rubrisoli]TDD80704.1 ABC transporter permease [Actinomadura rubrisoli]
MWHPGLVVRRMAGDRTLVLAACATALFATTVLAALTGYAGSVTREGLRRTLAEATFDTAGTRIAAHVPAGGLDGARQRVDGALRQIYRDVPLTVSVGVRSDSYTLPGQERRDHPELTAFATYAGIEKHARLAQGRWPAANGAAAAKDAEMEAALPGAAARAMRVRVGDSLTVRGRIDREAVARVKVVGLFDADRPDDYFWQGDRLITTGVERLDYTTHGPFVVPPEVFAGRFTGSGADVRWTVMPDLRGVDTGELMSLGDRVAKGGEVFQKAGNGSPVTAVTSLPKLTGQLHGAVMVARSTMLIPVLQLILLAGYAWILVARLLGEHRRAETALLRTRGASIRQLAGLGLVEGLLIVLPAALLGPLLAAPLLRLAGYAPAVRDSGLRLDAGPLAPLWAVSVATALACAVVLTVPTLRGANRTFVETQTGIGRTARGGLRGSGADLALLLVAALAVWQLTRYGASGSTDEDGPSGIDPVIVSGPALALLAGGVLLLRLVPVASRTAERATTRGRGLAPALGARQVSRRPLRYAGPALLLVMAMAVGVLSVTTMGTWRRSQTDQADFQTGADLRLERPSLPGGPAALGQGGRFASLPGVTAATGVVRKDVTVGTTSGTLLAADARALDPILRVRPGLRDDLDLAKLAAGRPAPPVLAVPGRPGRLLFDLRLTKGRGGPPPFVSTGPDDQPPPRKGTYQVAVTIEDAHGQTQRVTLAGLRPDGRTQTIAVSAADLAGPGGVLSYPLSVRGLHYVYDDNDPSGSLELGLVRVRGEGTGDATAPAGARWNVFDGPRDEDRPLKPGELATLSLRATASREGWQTGTGQTVDAMLATSAPPKRSTAQENLQPAVPGIITEETAARARVGVGATFTLGTADGDQPVTVAGIVPALPSTAPDRPGVLVDLPTLTERRLAAASAGPESTRPGEWWASVRDSRTAPAARAMAGHRAWGDVAGDRAATRTRLRDAPLGAALQGALVLGFGAALIFAVIAFVVNAAVSVRERAREFAVLRVLGVRPRQVAGMLAVEQAFLVALGLLGGLALGLVVARLVIPHIVLTVQAAPPYPPADLIVQWPVVLAMFGGVGVVLGLLLALVIRMLHRRDLGAGLRVGEE